MLAFLFSSLLIASKKIFQCQRFICLRFLSSRAACLLGVSGRLLAAGALIKEVEEIVIGNGAVAYAARMILLDRSLRTRTGRTLRTGTGRALRLCRTRPAFSRWSWYELCIGRRISAWSRLFSFRTRRLSGGSIPSGNFCGRSRSSRTFCPGGLTGGAL